MSNSKNNSATVVKQVGFKKFVPELKSNFLSDTFVDYEGVERHFTVAAVSVPIDEVGSLFNTMDVVAACAEGKDLNGTTTDDVTFEKVLFIGVAIQRKEDTFNEELGKRIAYGKALKNKNRYLYVSHRGLVNTPMVEALIRQEADYFKKDPGFYIAGYDKAEKEYNNSQGKTINVGNLFIPKGHTISQD